MLIPKHAHADPMNRTRGRLVLIGSVFAPIVGVLLTGFLAANTDTPSVQIVALLAITMSASLASLAMWLSQ